MSGRWAVGRGALLATLASAAVMAGGCDDPTYSQATASPSDLPDDLPGELPLFFVAQEGESRRVVAVTASTGRFATFGPPLPAAAETARVGALYTNPDGTAVLVRLTSDSAHDVVYFSDGGRWVDPLAGLDGAEPFKVAPTLDMIWAVTRLDDVQGGEAEAAVHVVSGQGEILVAEPVRRWVDTRLVAFSPDGGWLALVREGTSLDVVHASGESGHLRTLDGAEGVVPRVLYTAFASSVILVDAWPGLTWVALDGRAIDVEGFKANELELQGLYVVERGLPLRVLADRAVLDTGVRVGTLDGKRVLTHDRRYGLAASDTSGLNLYDPQGEVRATFRPEPSDAAPQGVPFTERGHTASVTDLVWTEDGAVALVRTNHFISDGDWRQDVELTWDLWTLDASGAHAQRFLRGSSLEVPALSPRLAPDGRSVLWVQDQQLRRLRLDDGVNETLGQELRFEAVVGRVPTITGD